MNKKFIATLERVFGGLAAGVHHHPWRSFCALVVMTGLAIYGARQLELNTDLGALLPPTFDSVQDLNDLEEQLGGVGYLTVVGRSSSPTTLIRFANDAAQALQSVEGVRYVTHRRDGSFFQDRAFYYLSVDELLDLEKRLFEREEWERRQRNPLYLDLEDTEPPSLDFTGLHAEHLGGGGIARFIGSQNRISSDDSSYFLDSEAGIIAILVKPKFISTDLRRSRALVQAVRSWADATEHQGAYDDLSIALTGRYTKRVDEQTAVLQDFRRASVLALALILIYLWFHFNRILAVAMMIGPLLLGILWAFGTAGFVVGSLNILSAFAGAILLGMGIDHGIHLLGRFQEEFGANTYTAATPLRALRHTFGKSGRAVVVAAITTTIAFLGLATSEFRGFSQFGAVAAIGTLALVLSYLLVLPLLLTLALRLGWRPKAMNQGHTNAPYGKWLVRHGSSVFVKLGFVCILLLVGLPFARFDYNLADLQGTHLPAYSLDLEVNRILSYGQTPVVLIAQSDQEERYLLASLRQSKQQLGQRSTIDFVAGQADLVPPFQQQKQTIIRRIGQRLERIQPSWLEPQRRPLLEQAKRASQARPFTLEDVPVSVRRQFKPMNAQNSVDAAERSFILAFPSIEEEDSREILAFADELRSVSRPQGQRVIAAGEVMVLSDILHMVRTEGPPVLFFTAVAVLLVVWLLLGRWQLALLSLAPALLTLLLTLATIAFFGIRINYLNVVVFPVLFGVGVDGGVHLISRLQNGLSLPDTLAKTGRSVGAAILTSALGFGSMLVAVQAGLKSVGSLAVLGLGINFLACLLLLPAMLVWWTKRRGIEAFGISRPHEVVPPEPKATTQDGCK